MGIPVKASITAYFSFCEQRAVHLALPATRRCTSGMFEGVEPLKGFHLSGLCMHFFRRLPIVSSKDTLSLPLRGI